MRLIDADKMAIDEREAYLSAQIKVRDGLTRRLNYAVHWKMVKLIEDAPTVDVTPVIHGHWICEVTDQEKGFGKVTCSHCGYECFVGVGGAKITTEYIQSMCEEDHFCSKCGAKMDEKEADDESQLD